MKSKACLVVALLLLTREARADSPLVVTLSPKRVFLARGFSIRKGDWFVVEPSVLFASEVTPGEMPIVAVVRPMLGIGGAGVGIGLALGPATNAPGAPPTPIEDAVSFLPVSLEAHVERTYGPTSWRHAIYLGPQVSLSMFVLKASAGWMFDATDPRNSHAQLAVGCGF